MNNFKPKFIIIGASSKIGSAFFKYFKNSVILGTQNRQKFKKLKKFDILKNNFNSLLKDSKATHVVIFSSQTDVNKCFLKQKYSNKLNFLTQKEIISKSLKNKITPIVFSTDYVFDGKSSYSTEKSITHPILEYGKQKKKLEDFVLKKNIPALVLRLSRVYNNNINGGDFLADLINSILSNKNISVDNSQFFSPIYINDVVKIIYNLAQRKQTGLFNLAGPERLNRYIIAKRIVKYLKINRKFIKKDINDFDLFEKRPLDVSMNTNKVKKITKFKFSNIDSIIKKFKF